MDAETRALLHARAASYGRDANAYRALAAGANPGPARESHARMAIVAATVRDELRAVAGGQAPPVTLREGDTETVALATDAVLVLDASNCLVLATPERRITVTNVAAWREALAYIKVIAQLAPHTGGTICGRCGQHHTERSAAALNDGTRLLARDV